MCKKISVDDYMPNQDTEVVVYTKTDSFRAIHCSLRKDWIRVKGGVRVYGITHWEYPSKMTNSDLIRHIAKGQQTLNNYDFAGKIAEIAEDMRHLPTDRLGIVAGLVLVLRHTSWGLTATTTEFVSMLSFENLIEMADVLKVPHDEDQWTDDAYPDKEQALHVAVAEALSGPPVDKQPEPEQLGPCTTWDSSGRAKAFGGTDTNPLPLDSAFPENQHSTYAEDEPLGGKDGGK